MSAPGPRHQRWLTLGRLLVPIVCLGIWAACGDPALLWEDRAFEQTAGDCDSTRGCARVVYRYPDFRPDDDPVVAALDRFVGETLLTGAFTGDPVTSFERLAEDFLDEYRTFLDEYPDGPGGWYDERHLEVVYQDATLLTLRLDAGTYAGGAHGLATASYTVLDRNTGKAIAPAALLPQATRTALTPIGERAFRALKEIPEGVPLRESDYFGDTDGTFHLSDDVGVTAAGLAFRYDPYEIAAYAYGETDLVLPWREVAPLLGEDGPLAHFRDAD